MIFGPRSLELLVLIGPKDKRLALVGLFLWSHILFGIRRAFGRDCCASGSKLELWLSLALALSIPKTIRRPHETPCINPKLELKQ